MHLLTSRYSHPLAPVPMHEIDVDAPFATNRGRFHAPVPVHVVTSARATAKPRSTRPSPARSAVGSTKGRQPSATNVRIAALEAQLAAVTAERDALAAKARKASASPPARTIAPAFRSPLERALRAAGISEKRIQLELAKAARKR